jgi:hypothetical protein
MNAPLPPRATAPADPIARSGLDAFPVPALAALAWVCAGVLFLAVEAFCAAAFQDYSYVTRYISELGVPYRGQAAQMVIDSPRATVMNLGAFMGEGLLFGIAVLSFRRAPWPPSRARTTFIVLGLLHAAGMMMVGAVHGGPHEFAAKIGLVHKAGAALAIGGGNFALITAGVGLRRFAATNAYARASLLLGVFGLLSAALLSFNDGTPEWPRGLLERGSSYSIIAWEIGTGVALWIAARRRAAAGLVRA